MSQNIKPSAEIKKIEPEKEKIEIKRGNFFNFHKLIIKLLIFIEKIESPMPMDIKQEKKPYKQIPPPPGQQPHYKPYNRNYSESPQNYKYNRSYHQDNYNRGGGGGGNYR